MLDEVAIREAGSACFHLVAFQDGGVETKRLGDWQSENVSEPPPILGGEGIDQAQPPAAS